MRVRRSQRVDAPAERVWDVVADPWSLPRWWPRTERVEAVEGDTWTTVLVGERGRSLRADWQVVEQEPGRRRRWAQDLEGSPFANLLTANEVEVALEPAGEGATKVTVEIDQALRGWARLAPFLVKGAARRQAGEALAGLRELF